MCTICLETKTKLILCECGNTTCIECQHTFNKLSCAACGKEYTQAYLESVSSKLLKTLVRPIEEEMLWSREKGLLPATQALLDWESQVTALNKQKRFGFHVVLPPKPLIAVTSNAMFPCPSSLCRGFISNHSCGTCRSEICKDCREILSSSHACKPEILASIKAIQSDSKNCPSCSASIFKIQGCNHMFCTNCRTHFEWLTGEILRTSTNHHYDNVRAFARPSVPEVTLSDEFKKTSEFRFMWTETKMIRCYMEERLDRRQVAHNHYEALVKVRMNFLKGIDEGACKKKVWILEKAYECKIQERNILGGFLEKVAGLQSEPDLVKFGEMCKEATSALGACNSNIKLIVGAGPLLIT